MTTCLEVREIFLWQKYHWLTGKTCKWTQAGIQKRPKLQIPAESRPSSALLNYMFHLTMFIISKQWLWGKYKGRIAICANCSCLVEQQRFLGRFLRCLGFLWHSGFDAFLAAQGQSKHILNVHLLQCSSCSTAYAFRITSWELLQVLMDAYLRAQTPKVFPQPGPCCGHLLLHSSSSLITVREQDSNQVLKLQIA